jgi:hypothetical protein
VGDDRDVAEIRAESQASERSRVCDSARWGTPKFPMRHWWTGRVVPMLAFGMAAAAVPAIVLLIWGEHTVAFTGTLHFYAVGISALVAAAAAGGLRVIGARRGDRR